MPKHRMRGSYTTEGVKGPGKDGGTQRRTAAAAALAGMPDNASADGGGHREQWARGRPGFRPSPIIPAGMRHTGADTAMSPCGHG